MTLFYAPGVHVELVDPPARIDPGRVDVAAFVAVCERGPVDQPVRLSSWRNFEQTYGTFAPNGLGAYAVKAFFDNGGTVCHVARVAAPERETSLVGPQASRLVSVVTDLDGLVAGAAATIVQLGRLHQHLVVTVDQGSSEVTWDRPLHPDLDLSGVNAVFVRTGAGTAATELVDGSGVPVVGVMASGPGGFGDRVSVRVTSGRRAATASRPGEPAVAGATPVDRVDGFAAGSMVHVTQATPTLVEAIQLIRSVDARRRVLVWEVPLPPSFDLTQPIRCETDTFTLSVLENGNLQEVHEDLVLVAGHPRAAVASVARRSRLVRLVDLSAGNPRHPAADQPEAVAGAVLLRGGRDGTAALRLDDVLGDEDAGVRRGLAAFADIDEPAAVAAPDLVAEPTDAYVRLPPPPADPCLPCSPPAVPAALTAVIVEAGARFTDDEVALAQQRMLDHCERRGDRLAVLDPPAGARPLDVGALVGWRARFDSTFGCFHGPWLQVVDPLAVRPGLLPTGRPSGALRRVPPSGHVVGLLARVDHEVGPWQAPANRRLAWAVGVDVAIDDVDHALLNEQGVSTIRTLPGRGVVVMGARTLTRDLAWTPLNVRRLFLHVHRALAAGLAWTVFEPADSGLDVLMGSVVAAFAEGLFEGGALVGDRPEDSFDVRVGMGDRLVGEVILELRLAAARPNEMILLRVSRTDNRLELTESPERST